MYVCMYLSGSGTRNAERRFWNVESAFQNAAPERRVPPHREKQIWFRTRPERTFRTQSRRMPEEPIHKFQNAATNTDCKTYPKLQNAL